MENTDQSIQKREMPAPLVAAFAVLCCALTPILPVLLLVSPALGAYAALRTKPRLFLALALASAALAYGIYGAVATAGMTLACVGTGAVILLMQTRKLGNGNTALCAAGAALLGLYGVVCMPGVVAGTGAFETVQTYANEIIKAYQSALHAMEGLPAEALTMLDGYLDALCASISSYVVPALCAAAGVIGLSGTLFFRLFAQRRPKGTLAPMRAFRFWEMPRSMMFGLLVLLLGSLVLEWTGWGYAEGLTGVVNVLVAMPLMLQGLCVVDFFLCRNPRSLTLKRTLVYTAIVVLFSVLQTPLMLTGCMEQIFRLRTRASTPPRAAI